MRNLWLMAAYEYRRLARRRTFLLSTLGFPLLIVILIGVIIFMTERGGQATLGYVDRAGIVDPTGQIYLPAQEAGETAMIGYANIEEATAALEAGTISAFYVLPADYRESRQVELYHAGSAPGNAERSHFRQFIRAHLVADLPEPVQQRVIEGTALTVRSADGSRAMGAGDIVGFLFPFAVVMLFIFAVMTSAGYLLQVVTDEKENRTMEILVTSLRPIHMIMGKSLGLMALALTQLGIWVLAVGLAIAVGSRFWEPLQGIAVPWTSLGLMALFFLPSYALIAGMMTAIGGAVTEARQGQQVAGILNLLFVLPLFVLGVLMEAPHSPIAVGLTFFPTTALVTTAMRSAFAVVPFWQLAVSWSILVVTALLSLWISARIFRAGMLRYGQPLSLRAVMASLKAS
jgi:ABC-2 type transport system permease protein